jgi:alpha-tubulin suppressor-like RCC1 family protein
MSISNFEQTLVDLDYIYVPATDANYVNASALNVTNRKTVVFGQQSLVTYPIGNVITPFVYNQNVNYPQSDQDPVNIVGVGPTGVVYKNRTNNTSQIRGRFDLLENTPQTADWFVTGLTNRSSPVQVGSLSNWSVVSCGYAHSAAIKTNSTLWTWGYNADGELGTSNTTNRSSPVQVGALSGWKQISCGYYYTMAIQTNGTLWGWGQNQLGHLGTSNTTSYSSPIQISTLSVWTSVACGYAHTVAIQSNGTLWSWGSNSQGQLGINTSTLSYVLSPVQIGGLSNWTKIFAGGFLSGSQTLAIQSDNSLWAWGSNSYGQLGLNTSTLSSVSSPVQISTSVWSQVACGVFHTAAIQSNGTLWAWGYNSLGQLGLSDTTNRSTPVQVGSATTWTRVAAGYYYTIALQTNGTLWTWGMNSYGQLGTSDLTHRSSPIQIGTASNWAQVSSGASCILGIQTNSTLWTWGLNNFGQLGLAQSGIPPTKLNYGL